MVTPRIGFDLIDGRTLFARFAPALSARDLEYLLASIDGLQWTEARLVKAIDDFARDCDYEVVTMTLPRASSD